MNAVLRDFRELAPGVRHFEFDVPSLDRFDFAPGQWVSLTGTVNGKAVTRAYSIASTPAGNRFALCLNRVPEGVFSPLLFALRPGDAIAMKGPYGTFAIRDPSRDMIMVATGTGVAPFRSMLENYFAAGGLANVTLVFGVRYERSLYYRDEFENWQARRPDFWFWPVLSRPGSAWTGRVGHVQPHVIEAIGERRDLDIYICGLHPMVDDLRQRLKAAGFDRKHILFEKYD